MEAEPTLLCVYPQQVDEFWPHVYSFIKSATDHCGTWSVAEIKHQLDKGALLWIVWGGNAVSAACVTRLVREDRGLVLEALACGGEGQDWRRLYEDIEDYGRNEGCAFSRISGREGWKKIFSDYQIAWVTLERRLDK